MTATPSTGPDVHSDSQLLALGLEPAYRDDVSGWYRYAAPGYPGAGVIYSPHLALRWAAHWLDARGECHIVWTRRLDTVLEVLRMATGQ